MASGRRAGLPDPQTGRPTKAKDLKEMNFVAQIKDDADAGPDMAAHGAAPLDGNGPFLRKVFGDARRVPLSAGEADLVVTSPPYWLKRDYGIADQIGQEKTPDAYVSSMLECMHNWREILPPWGSVFINIGDTYSNGNACEHPRTARNRRSVGWMDRPEPHYLGQGRGDAGPCEGPPQEPT